ncbi:peroxisome assembly protein [Trypanosoma rangeli]|uniref:Peroxisome assembly protein n=1 Tax=Trypanosoma rangeli TaxID=5698 RepID=A0A422NAE6_TRYRA|nr:peroxisome assembly protein [Trypanosoma rangeli]RNF02435.1 peroxisome assembly protein [Trypanosoma rangeli]|eukprot:RNF02435.1 peroxisome assembly protein [Trypanosoma rangeli]
MGTDNMEAAVQLELCILRAVTPKDYQCVVEHNCGMDGNSVCLLQTIMQHNAMVQLGQTILACDIFSADLTVVDLAPATAGVLCDATTIIVLPPTRGDAFGLNDTTRITECSYKDDDGNVDANDDDDDLCVAVLDDSLTGSTAESSEGFFLRTLMMDGAVVCVGDEEYTTAFSIHMRRQGKETAEAVPHTARRA